MSEPQSEIPTQPKAPKVVIGNFEQNSPEFFFYKHAAIRAGVTPNFEVVKLDRKQKEQYVQMYVPKFKEKIVRNVLGEVMATPKAILISKANWRQPVDKMEVSVAFGEGLLASKLIEYSKRPAGDGIDPFTPEEMEKMVDEVYNTLPEPVK